MADTHLTLIFIIFLVTFSLTWATQQKINRFFRFDEQSDSWVPVELPYELVTCVNDNCTTVGSIRLAPEKGDKRGGEEEGLKKRDGDHSGRKVKDSYKKLLPLRKRVSLTKMSETSIWITGESGSIYERFWNGVQWVIAPHDLPSSAGPATSVFVANQTILALSEAGYLYQMHLTEDSQLIWTEFAAAVDRNASRGQEQAKIKCGIVSKDGERIYFCTKNGSLLELVEVEPPRWINHGQPPGADVAAIADVGTITPNLVFTISSAGHLYEHDKNAKPPWRKHIWKEGLTEDTSLVPSRGSSTQGLGGASSVSLFLITKAGKLVERRLSQRKWKWMVHGSSENQLLTSITLVLQNESSDNYSVFLTTASGSILEYQTIKQAGATQEHQIQESWVNHLHPPHAKVARGVPGISYQFGRTFFALDDGRLAELHLSGIGGENSGPIHQVNIRRKMPLKYVWSILDVPEIEGWNAEYCTEERGPSNCILGTKDDANDFGNRRSMTRRRKGMQQTYLIPDASAINVGQSLEDHQLAETLVKNDFRMRVMQGGRSFFVVTHNGLTFEYLYNDDVGLWLRHEHSTPMDGAVGSYNGSLFFVDIHGSLLIRQRSNNELQWINCTAMKKGRQIISGPPWDRIHGSVAKFRAEEALYFVSKNGRLLQFTVALRNFKWKDCKNPANMKIATIVDQEVLRDKVVFVIGRNGRLYQYNILSGLWHEHYQSQHLFLSRSPGTAMRLSSLSLKGSLFMISEDGGLVEYHWSSLDGWMWIEHGTPNGGVSFVGAPGPSYEGHQLFLIGSDGKVYLRYFDQVEWKWRDCGFPDSENLSIDRDRDTGPEDQDDLICINTDSLKDTEDNRMSKTNRNCDPKVASTRPFPSAQDTVIFELRDGRLAELCRVKDTDWIWSRIIATPMSLCMGNFWAAVAS